MRLEKHGHHVDFCCFSTNLKAAEARRIEDPDSTWWKRALIILRVCNVGLLGPYRVKSHF